MITAVCVQCEDVLVCDKCLVSGKHRGHQNHLVSEYEVIAKEDLDRQKKVCEDSQKIFEKIFSDAEKIVKIEEKVKRFSS